jgi:hypothetical protein
MSRVPIGPSRRTFQRAWIAFFATLGGVQAFACSSTKTPAGLEILLSTDMHTPVDFDVLRLEISQETSPGKYSAPLVSNDFLIPQEATLPTSFSIAAGAAADQNALIRVIAKKNGVNGTVVVLREAEVQVPRDRVAELPMVISSSCAAPANFKLDASGEPQSSCTNPAQSCQPATGKCGDTLVSQESLATFRPGDGIDAGLASTAADGAAPPAPDAASGSDATMGPDVAEPPADAEADTSSDGPGTVTSPEASDDGSVAYTTTLTTDMVSIPANGEAWYCQTFKNPFGAQVDIVQYEADMTSVAYQMFAYYDPNATDGAAASCAPPPGAQFTFASESTHDVLAYPTGVGATLAATTGFNLYVHYLNVGAAAAPGQVSVTMSVAKPGIVSQHAGVLYLEDLSIDVPPSGVSTPSASYTLTQAVTLFESESTMSRYATNFVLSDPAQTLYTTTNWAHPVPGILSPAAAIASGTVMTWRCTYDNISAQTLTFGASDVTNARCQSISFIYPITDVANPVVGNAP